MLGEIIQRRLLSLRFLPQFDRGIHRTKTKGMHLFLLVSHVLNATFQVKITFKH